MTDTTHLPFVPKKTQSPEELAAQIKLAEAEQETPQKMRA